MFDTLFIMGAQNSFLSKRGSAYLGEKSDVLKIRLIDYLSNFSGKKIFFREKRAKSDSFFTTNKTHSIVNTYDFPVLSSLKRYADIFYDKGKYSAFFGTGLDIYLERLKTKSIGLIGLETHTSILYTAEELRNRDCDVTVIEPCTASTDDYMHYNAISLMVNSLGVSIGE